MRANVNILTSASETSVANAVTGFENSTAAHVAGDLGAHNQVLFYATPFAEFVTGHTIPNGYLLRMMLTGTNADGSGDAVFTAPAIYTGDSTDVGGPPIIIRQPANLGVFTGQIAGFTVKAISAVPMTYQWRKNNANITGATSATYLIASAKSSDQASYDVVVTNEFGSVTSNSATLTVTNAPSGGGCFLPDTLITMADNSRRRIDNLKVGDRVASYRVGGLSTAEEAWHDWASVSLSVQPTVATITEVYKQTFVGYYQILDLKITPEHPVMVRRNGVWKFMRVAYLQPGDYLWRSGTPLRIDRINYVKGEIETWNINVEDTDVYLANGFLVHNGFFSDFFKSVWRFITPETALIGAIFY